MLLFVSYADEDDALAHDIVRRLGEHGIEVISRRPSGGAAEQAVDIEDVIGQADAFLAVMTPRFLGSPACRREREIALHRDRRQVASDGPPFIYVLQARATPYHVAGPMRARRWFDMTYLDPSAVRQWITELMGTPPAGGGDTSARKVARRVPPSFHNREQELEKVRDGLADATGEHFWLVTAPPKLGKTWFLDRIASDIQQYQPGHWTVRVADVREQPDDVRTSVESLLGMLLGFDHPVAVDQDGLARLATALVDTGIFHLCLLDSAELLTKETVRELRDSLGRLCEVLENAANEGVALCLIVASRREGGWLGVGKLRLRQLTLSEFSPQVVFAVMQKMRDQMGHKVGDAVLRAHAGVVHGRSEGLPALLYRYICWIHDERWVGLDRLKQNRQFRELAQPYIDEELLAPDSLFGPVHDPPTEAQCHGLEKALRALVPYRLLTQAHVSQRAGTAGAVQSVMDSLGWPVEKLWNAVSNTDLLMVPQRNLWEEIYPPIRRLLCRYWYPAEETLTYAHEVAEQFVRSWGGVEPGPEQVLVLVESLWHQAQVLRLKRAANAGDRLIDFARSMSEELVPSVRWQLDVLRQRAEERIRTDEELFSAADAIGVSLDRLVSAVWLAGSVD
jgi:TIR domain